jgi:hypothetical protein
VFASGAERFTTNDYSAQVLSIDVSKLATAANSLVRADKIKLWLKILDGMDIDTAASSFKETLQGLSPAE